MKSHVLSASAERSWLMLNPLLAIVLLAAALVGCGGSGGSGESGGSSSVTLVSVDPGLPASVDDSIQQVVSPSGSAQVGSYLNISTAGQTGQSIALAVDATGNIVLASIVTSPHTELSSDSTAFALVRLVIGDVSTTQTGAAIDASIRANAGYSDLVAAVRSALDRGTSPAIDSVVLQGIAAVAVAVVPTIAASSSRARVFAVAQPSAVTPLPFTVAADTVLSGLLPVQLSNSGVGTVSLSNSMPIPWQVSTVSVSGASLENGEELPGRLGLLTPGIAIVAADNVGFNLTIAQTDATHSAIGADLVTGGLKTLLGFAGSAATSCSLTTVQSALDSALDKYLPNGLSWNSFTTSLKNFIAPQNLIPIVSACTSSPTLKEVLQPIVDLIEGVAVIKVVYNGVSAETEAAYAYAYWTTPPTTFGVCEGANWAVTNCADKYAFTPPSIILAPGAVYMPNVSAVDIAGAATLVPSGLTYKPSNANLLSIDQLSGQITATTDFGTVISGGGTPDTISVTDMETSATGSLSVVVLYPQITPATSSTVVGGGLVVLSLTDPSSNPVVLPLGVTWMSSDQSKATLTNFSLLTNTGTTSWYSPSGSAPGTVTISATAPDGTPYGTATITVTAGSSSSSSSGGSSSSSGGSSGGAALPDPGWPNTPPTPTVATSGMSHQTQSGCTNPSRDSDVSTPINSSEGVAPPFFGARAFYLNAPTYWTGATVNSNPFTTTYTVNATEGQLTSVDQVTYNYSQSGTVVTETLTDVGQYSGGYSDYSNFQETVTRIYQSSYDTISGAQSFSFSDMSSASANPSVGLDAGCSYAETYSESGSTSFDWLAN